MSVLSSSFLLFQPTMSTSFLDIMVDFGKIYHSDGSFKVDDINLDYTNTIKVVGKSGTLMGLPFFVFGKRACVSDY